MNKWRTERLEEIIHVNPAVKLTKGEVYPFIDIDKVSPKLRSVTNEEEKVYDGQSCSKFCNGDTVFSRITPCLENRKIAKVSIDGQAAFGSTEFYIFRAKDGKSDEDFVYYLTSSDAVVLPAINSMTGASGRQRADRRFIERTKLNVPDLPTQKRIADILSTYDNLIENNNRRIAVLEKAAQELYKEWFVRFRFPGYETAEFVKDKPRSWMVGKSTELERPIHWKFDTLSELGEFKRGKNITATQMVDGLIPVVSAGLEPAGYHNVANVYSESITISASGANAGYLLYHLDDIWAADCSYYQNDNLWFVYNTLKFLQPVISNMQVGAAQPHVYPKNINKLNIIIPDKKDRKSVV